MPEPFDFDCRNDLVFHGKSELIAQITQELACNPNSCVSKNIIAWYNSLYSELSDFTDCRYQVEINQELCECDTEKDELYDLLTSFVFGDIEGILVDYLADQVIQLGRRAGQRVINDIERQLRRRLRRATSDSP